MNLAKSGKLWPTFNAALAEGFVYICGGLVCLHTIGYYFSFELQDVVLQDSEVPLSNPRAAHTEAFATGF